MTFVPFLSHLSLPIDTEVGCQILAVSSPTLYLLSGISLLFVQLVVQHAVVNLFDHVTQMLETNIYVHCLSVDFSKAFNVVSHKVLL